MSDNNTIWNKISGLFSFDNNNNNNNNNNYSNLMEENNNVNINSINNVDSYIDEKKIKLIKLNELVLDKEDNIVKFKIGFGLMIVLLIIILYFGFGSMFRR